jgi:ketosteroid isomerase-like protein
MGGDLEDLAWEFRNRLAIEAVLLDYCELVDGLDYQGIANLFTLDGEFDLGFGRVNRGRDGVFKQMSTRMPIEYTHTSHHLSNIRIRFEGRELAHASSYVFAWHRQASDGRERKLFGRYYDDLVLTADGWKIQRRRLRAAGEDGYPKVAGQPGPFELIPRGERS